MAFLDLKSVESDDGRDEVVQYVCGLITGGYVDYFKLGEGGWVESPALTTVVGTGDGGSEYSGELLDQHLPCSASSLTIVADPTGAPQTVTDDGSGGFTGDGTGTINYKTGEWEVTFDSAVTASVDIQATYKTWGGLSDNQTGDVSTGNGLTGPYVGTLRYRPVAGGTVTISDGALTPQTVTDTPNSPYDGSGTLSGDGTGTIDYETGDVVVTFTSAVTSGNSITATYKYVGAAKAPLASLTDLESESDPDLYTYQEQFVSGDITFQQNGRISCKIDLERYEAIDDGDGNPPFFLEGGIFSANDVMLAYFTFKKSSKNGSTVMDVDIDLVI